MFLVLIEKVLHSRPLTATQIKKWQEEMDELDSILNLRYNMGLKHDAEKELIKQKRVEKGLSLIFGGSFLLIVLFLAKIITPNNDSSSLMIALASIFVLIGGGFIKMIGSRRLSIGFIVSTFFLGGGAFIALEYHSHQALYPFLYLCGLLLLMTIFFDIVAKK